MLPGGSADVELLRGKKARLGPNKHNFRSSDANRRLSVSPPQCVQDPFRHAIVARQTGAPTTVVTVKVLPRPNNRRTNILDLSSMNRLIAWGIGWWMSQVLEAMEQAIAVPNDTLKKRAPRCEIVRFEADRKKDLVGYQGQVWV